MVRRSLEEEEYRKQLILKRIKNLETATNRMFIKQKTLKGGKII